MLGLLKQIGELYVKQFLLTICLVAGAGVLLCLYMASGARLMSDRELAQRLEEMYGRDFVILESRKLEEAERAEGVWRAKVWQVAPAEEPERRFWAYNIVSGGVGGVAGVTNGLRDTYGVDMVTEAFCGQAAGLDYELRYRSYPFRQEGEGYSSCDILVGPFGPEELDGVCRVLAGTVAETLAQLPEDYDLAADLGFMLYYREADWPEGAACLVRTWSNQPAPGSEEEWRELILAEAASYARLFIEGDVAV